MLQFIINGLITGVLYSLMAIGFSLVYNTTKVFHIAAAGIYVFAAYMFYSFSTFLPMIPAALIAIVLTMGLSLLTEFFVYRPLWKRKASNNVAMIASIGLMAVIVNLLTLKYGTDSKLINKTIFEPRHIGDITITIPQMMQFIIGTVVILFFLIFIEKNGWGARFRALSADVGLFETLGYNIPRTRTVVFLMSGAIIALGSCLTEYNTRFDSTVGMSVLINALVAMIIGGVGRFGTCVIGGVILGVIQSGAVLLFSASWQNAVTFAVLLLLLFFRPQGIAGYQQRAV